MMDIYNAKDLTAQGVYQGMITTEDREAVPDVAITVAGRPTYFSDKEGRFLFAAGNDGPFTVEKIERKGYEVMSPRLPYTAYGNRDTLKVVMRSQETPTQREVREYGELLYNKAMEQEQQRLYGDAADTLIKRASLDEDNVRWQYEAGQYMHKYGDYRTAQTFYNRAITKAKELYSEKNQYLALCYELYGDNYYVWRVWGEESVMNYADAKNYYQQAGHYWYTLYGETNEHTASIYYKMAVCWMKLDNETNALKALEKMLEVEKVLYGEFSPKYQQMIQELRKLK